MSHEAVASLATEALDLADTENNLVALVTPSPDLTASPSPFANEESIAVIGIIPFPESLQSLPPSTPPAPFAAPVEIMEAMETMQALKVFIGFFTKLLFETVRAIQRDVLKIFLLAAVASLYRALYGPLFEAFGFGLGRTLGQFGDLAGGRLRSFFMLGRNAPTPAPRINLRRVLRVLRRLIPYALILRLLAAWQHARSEAMRLLEAQRLLDAQPLWRRLWRKYRPLLAQIGPVVSSVIGTGSAFKYLLSRGRLR